MSKFVHIAFGDCAVGTLKYFFQNNKNEFNGEIINAHYYLYRGQELVSEKSELIYEDEDVEVHTIPLTHRIYTNGFLFKEKEGERKLDIDAAEKCHIDMAYYRKLKQGYDVENEEGEILVNVNNIAEAMNCKAEIHIEKVTIPVSNDPGLVQLMTSVVQEVDPDAQIDPSHQTMGSEDFSFLTQDIPGCFIMVGSANHEKGLDYSHHHPKFNIDEACLPFSVAIIAQGAIEILEKQPKAFD